MDRIDSNEAIEDLHHAGLSSAEIALILNRRKATTIRGKEWTAANVARVLRAIG